MAHTAKGKHSFCAHGPPFFFKLICFSDLPRPEEPTLTGWGMTRYPQGLRRKPHLYPCPSLYPYARD